MSKKTKKISLGAPKKKDAVVEEKIVKKEAKADGKKAKKSGQKVKAKKVGVMVGPSGRTRTRIYMLPKPKEASPEKMDAQLKRLRERKLVSSKVKTLIGAKIVKEHNGQKYVIVGTKKGWLRKDTGKYFTSLFGVACDIVNGPRNGYLFFGDQLKSLHKTAEA